MIESNKPLTLLLGNIDREGVASKLKASERQYKKKILDSNVDNWSSIIEYFDDFTVNEVIVKLSSYTYQLIASEDYKNIAEDLFSKIAKVSNIIFVYESLWSGVVDIDEDQYQDEALSFYNYRPDPPDENSLIFVNALLERIVLNIIPYRTNAELTVLALTFLDQTEQNLFFRIYIPSGRMWALESDKLLQLFRDYLSKASDVNIRLDQYRTDKGTIFEFHGNAEESQSFNISEEFDNFSRFLDLCVSNPSDAEILLKTSKELDNEAVYEIVARYTKEAKRLVIDLKDERVKKMLGVRHRLESELIEVIPSNFDWKIIDNLIELAVPKINGFSSTLGVPLQLSSDSTITVSVQPQIINSLNEIVAQEIIGDRDISEDAKILLDLIHKYGGKKSSDLVSGVHELADESAPDAGRISARQKLKKFVFGLSSPLKDIAVGVLKAYIESKFGL